ncbi:MAG: depolymerase family esterase [Proteobacteria bacterium]|nr:depolymerase family esterase [Pseudomonadota bacterium]
MNKMMMKALPAAVLLSASLSAAALTPGSGKWVVESASYGTPNLQNAYVYVPANTNPAVAAGKRALMLTMHGCGQTAQGNVIEGAFNWEATAEKYGMVVVAPTVPSGTTSTRSVSGCWDWFGTGWTRTNRDQVPLKKLIDSIISRPGLDIDKNQVYVTGLSSGGGLTLVMACAFPDVFAGLGSNAGPALGAAAGDISVAVKITPAQISTNCKNANGNAYNEHFKTQIFSTVYGDKDTLVKPEHNTANAKGFGVTYGVDMTTPAITESVEGGLGTAKIYKDANGKERISDLMVPGMAHAWPAGKNAPKKYIAFVDSTRVNYPEYITPWFFKNNMRLVTLPAPTNLTCTTTDSTVSLKWDGVQGATGYAVYRGATKIGAPTATNQADSGLKTGSTYTYKVTGTAQASEGAAAEVKCTTTGPVPVLDAPAGVNGTSTVNSVALTWTAVEGANGYIVYRNGSRVGTASAANFADSGLVSATAYSYAVTTLNSANVESAKSVAVTVTTKVPQCWTETASAASYTHYSAKRLTLNQYLAAGSKLGYSTVFPLYKYTGGWTNKADCSAMAF